MKPRGSQLFLLGVIGFLGFTEIAGGEFSNIFFLFFGCFAAIFWDTAYKRISVEKIEKIKVKTRRIMIWLYIFIIVSSMIMLAYHVECATIYKYLTVIMIISFYLEPMMILFIDKNIEKRAV